MRPHLPRAFGARFPSPTSSRPRARPSLHPPTTRLTRRDPPAFPPPPVACAVGLAAPRATSRVHRPSRARVVPRAASRDPTPGASPRVPRPPPGRGVSARWILDTRYGHKAAALELLGEWVHTVAAAAGVDPANVRILTGAVGCPDSRVELHVDQFATLAEMDAFLASIPGAAHRAWGERFAPHVVDGSPTWHVLREVPARTATTPEPARDVPEVTGSNPTAGDAVADAILAALSASSSSTSTAPSSSSPPPPLVIRDGAVLDSLSGEDDASDAAAAIERAMSRGGFSMPPKIVPRAPRSLTPEQMAAPVFDAGDFGDGDGDGRGLVFPGSVAEGGEKMSEKVSEENGVSEKTVGSVFTPRDDPFGDDAAREEIDLSEYEPGSKIVYDWKGDPMVIQPGDKLPNVM